MNNKFKPIEFYKKLPTKRLLAFYKKHRTTLYSGRYVCDCCWQNLWDLYPKDPISIKLKEEYEFLKTFLAEIKLELDNREHINK